MIGTSRPAAAAEAATGAGVCQAERAACLHLLAAAAAFARQPHQPTACGLQETSWCQFLTAPTMDILGSMHASACLGDREQL